MGRMLHMLRWPVVAAIVWAVSLMQTPLGLAADAPIELAGIRLGQPIDEMAGKLVSIDGDKAFLRPYIGVLPVVPVPGFRSGYVDFGLCTNKRQVVRIKMNYADDSLEFFGRVMEALKKRYGEPKEWRGNAFGTLRTWKWSLKTADGRPISLILMHYAGDDGAFTEGNSIRIAATDLVRAEQACHAAKESRQRTAQDGKSGARTPDNPEGEWFLPR